MFFLCPVLRLKIWSHETYSAIPSRASPPIFQTLVESGAYSRVPSSCFPRRRPSISSTAIGSVPSLSCHAFAYRWCPLPSVHLHRASSRQGNSCHGCYLFRYQHRATFARLFSHTHYWYGGHVRYRKTLPEASTDKRTRNAPFGSSFTCKIHPPKSERSRCKTKYGPVFPYSLDKFVHKTETKKTCFLCHT